MRVFIATAWLLSASLGFAQKQESVGSRIKDLVEFRGVRSNPLVGFGLVVGLPGTGDSKQSLATNKAVSNLLTRLGSTVGLKDVTTKNAAAVIVTAELPPFARVGSQIDIRISSIGDAASLEGGTLLLTPLSAANSQVYAVAQGTVSMGTAMAGAEGGGGNKSMAPKTIALASAATVEREFEQTFVSHGILELGLKNPDFTTSSRMAQAINRQFNEFIADAVNAGLVRVKIPTIAHDNQSYTHVNFVSVLEQIEVTPDSRAIVVISERTGTLIAGSHVTIEPVAISHGSLEIQVGKTKGRVGTLEGNTTIGDLVRSLNALGAGPKDLVAILQALKAANALRSDLKIM